MQAGCGTQQILLTPPPACPLLHHLTRHRLPCVKVPQLLPCRSKPGQQQTCTGTTSIACTANRSPAAAEISNSPAASASSLDEDQQGSGTPSTSGSRSKDGLPTSLLRRLSTFQSASDAAEALLEAEPSCTAPSERSVRTIIVGALERGNLPLAMSLYDSMCQARGRMAVSAAAATATTSGNMSQKLLSKTAAGGIEEDEEDDAPFSWPPATTRTTSALVLGLCKQLAITEALAIVNSVSSRGLPRHDAIGFGKVIASPLVPTQTLTVVPPQEGCMMVADAFSKYEYEVFTGAVVSTKSEALQANTNLLYSALRMVGILRRPAPAAVHEFVVQAPDGNSRTFRVATPTADVPAQEGERVTFVCAPGPDRGGGSSGSGSNKGAPQVRRKAQQGLLPSNPPGTKPGEALTATNHRTGMVMQLLPPPLSNMQQGVPGWVLPAALLLTGGDAASSLIDPSLPLLLAAGAGGLLGSVVAGDRLLLPRLRQLPDQAVTMEYMRQTLLGQYAQLGTKVEAVLSECSEDVRVLARLWQLQNKMQSVGSSMSASYGARMERVINARSNIEQRLSKKLELLDGYGRVMNMIEIEVEIDTEVPAAEFEGIAEQMQRLDDLESLQDDWKAQAESRDEVERLLRSL